MADNAVAPAPETDDPTEPGAKAGAVKMPRSMWGFTIFYALSYLGVLVALLVPTFVTLAVRVGEAFPDQKELLLGQIVGVGAIAAILANPIFGALSDRTRSRFGMRRPWIVGGVVVGAAALIAMAFADQIWQFFVLWFVVQAAWNAALAGLMALLPDQVPEEFRGRVSGILGFCLNGSQLLGLLIINIISAMGGGTLMFFVIPTLIGGVLGLSVLITRKDRMYDESRPRASVGEFFKSFKFNPLENRDFSWAWLSKFFVQVGAVFPSAYAIYFMSDYMKLPLQEVLQAQLGMGIAAAIATSSAAYLGGFLSDRFARRKIFIVMAGFIILTGGITIATSSTIAQVIIGTGITSIGSGLYYAVDLALVASVLPNSKEDAAKDMGIFNIAAALPGSFVPMIAPLVLAIGGGGNYPMLYIVGGVCGLLGGFAVLPVKRVR